MIAVKPQDMERMLDEIADLVAPSQLVISMAAGITTSFIERRFPVEVPVVRVMSNTPALVDEAMSVISAGSFAGEEHLRHAEELLAPLGKVIRIPEYQQDAATALSGSGPAYVFYLVEAMVDAGILLGMPRRTALEMVTQTVYGAATMLRDSGEHPVILRDAVTSPAGTTIAAIRELEKHGVRAAFLAAIEAARDRGRELGERMSERRAFPRRYCMSGSAAVVWDEALTRYDFGAGHPFDPVRIRLTMALASELGVLSSPAVTMISPSPATDAEIETVHDPEYVAVVRQVGRALVPAVWFGLGTDDDPVFEGMHEAAALVVGATLAAARSVWSGATAHAVSVAGGHHHAMRANASGFCVYNDLAVAIRWLLSAGAERVAYVDLDVHHGDGVQAAFYDDPRVLTISLHEHPATLFPGTGLPGRDRGRGR